MSKAEKPEAMARGILRSDLSSYNSHGFRLGFD